MYFSGRGENNIYSSLKGTLINEKFDAWLDSLSENIEVVKFDSFEQVGGMIAGIAQAAEEHAAAQEAESEADSNASDSENSSEGAESGAENESSEDSGSEG